VSACIVWRTDGAGESGVFVDGPVFGARGLPLAPRGEGERDPRRFVARRFFTLFLGSVWTLPRPQIKGMEELS